MREENVKVLQVLGWEECLMLVLWSDNMALLALRVPY